MSKAIYIATIEPHSGKSIVSLGLLRMMLTKSSKVGYFRPIISDTKEGEIDNHINTAINFFNLDIDPNSCYAFQNSEVINLISEGKRNEVIDEVINKYKQLEERYDYVLIEGSDFSGEGSLIEFEMNISIAKNLSVPVVIVGSGMAKNRMDFVNSMQIAYQAFREKEVDVIGLVANKIQEEEGAKIQEELAEAIGDNLQIDVIPMVDTLEMPSVKEVSQALNGKVLFGDKFLDNPIGNFGVGAMQLRNYLTHIKEDSLVVTPGDRADIILGALQANQSMNYPKIAGIILTGGLIPEPSILKLIENMNNTVPVVSVEGGTFNIANKAGEVKSKIYASNKNKIIVSLNTFDSYVDVKALASTLTSYVSDKTTPRMFQYNLLDKAKQSRKHIVLPEGKDDRILTAAARLQLLNVVDLTILGNVAAVKQRAHNLGLDLSKIQIIDPTNTSYKEEFVSTLFELRKHKGVTTDIAKDLITDVSYFGTLMILNGYADGMVSGAAHTTQHTIRPALQLIKTKPGCSVVSSVFFMCLEDRVSVMGDCAVNPNPNAEQLSEIAISSAKSAEAFGIEAKVAMLSYSSGDSGKGEEVDKVREATSIVKSKMKDLKIEGPIQYDAAVDMGVGQKKLPNSPVAGQASVLIFPDLNTGNNTYKAIQRESGALAIGPMLQGLNKPVNDLSRGCTIEDIYNTVLLTAVQAQQD